MTSEPQPETKKPSTTNVLIVGAGPVGLTLACELLRHGVRPRLIDRLDKPSPYCRAIGVTPRSLEMWEGLGVVRDMIDAGVWLTGTRNIIDGVAQDQSIDLDDLPYSTLGLPQYETERILTRKLESLGGVIERGVELVELIEDPEGTRVTLARASGERETIACEYVVGCDGAHSAVRKALGIPFEGSAMPYDFMLGDVRIDWEVPRGIVVRAIHPVPDAPPDLFIAVPLPERGRYRVSMLAPPELTREGSKEDHGIQSERPTPGLAALQAVADRLLPRAAPLSDLRWSSIFRIGMRLAARYRSGKVFLAGDAAHIHPPTGGQGMNTGIQDACNLAWKLALVSRGAAPASLLESYEAERRPIGQEVIARTTQATMRLGAREESADSARLADTQILVHYRGSAWVAKCPAEGAPALSQGPLPGDRVPDCLGLRRLGVGYPLRLFDLLRGAEHVLLAFLPKGSTEAPNLDAPHAAARLRAAGLLRVAAIMERGASSPQRLPSWPGIPCHADDAGTFGAAFGPAPLFLLVRPDGYLAWRGRSVDDPELARVLAGTFTSA